MDVNIGFLGRCFPLEKSREVALAVERQGGSVLAAVLSEG